MDTIPLLVVPVAAESVYKVWEKSQIFEVHIPDQEEPIVVHPDRHIWTIECINVSYDDGRKQVLAIQSLPNWCTHEEAQSGLIEAAQRQNCCGPGERIVYFRVEGPPDRFVAMMEKTQSVEVLPPDEDHWVAPFGLRGD